MESCGRAREAHLVDVRVHDLREYTHDRHRTVDDRPFGGGEGNGPETGAAFRCRRISAGRESSTTENTNGTEKAAQILML